MLIPETKKILLFVFSLFLAACSTLKESGSQIAAPVDYSEENAVEYEIETLKKLWDSDTVKTSWRAYLLKNSFPDKESVVSFYEETCRDLEEELLSAIEKKNYFEALKIRFSLESFGWNCKDETGSSRQLIETAYKDVPFGSEVSSEKQSVEAMINGTVTVFVDKGIKVQHGMGYADSVLGSGFFISKDGYIVTNHHVIEDMVNKKNEGFSRLYIKLAEDPETRIPAKVVGYDKSLDLALLKTQIDAPYVFSLGSSSDLSVGDKIYVIGSPLGLDKTLTSGIISSFDRQLFLAGTAFQIDAAVNSGNSGGPMIDEKGRVQGIVFAGVPHYQGLNFAIPVEYLKMELPYLFNGGERTLPWICAYGKTKRLPGSGMKNEGVVVYYVLPGGSCDRAGIKEGDVITGALGQPVTSLDELKCIFMTLPLGCAVTLDILKNGETPEKKVVYLENRPNSPGYEIFKRDLLGDAMYPILGMKLVNSSSSNKRVFSITDIIKGSAADESKFSEHDPVEIYGIEFNDEHTAAYIKIQTQKRKKGFIDINMVMTCPLNTPYYF